MSVPAIVTDSSSQLSGELTGPLRIEVVPITIVVGGAEHAETDLDVDAFYEELGHGASVSTSLPSPGRLADAYRALAARGAHAAVSIHLDGRISGTAAAARLAAAAVDLPVTVVDTGTVSFGVGVCALAAARAAAAGATTQEIEELIAGLVPAIENVFVASTTEGRIGTGHVAAGPGLPLLSFVDGAARALGLCSGFAQAAEAMAARLPADRPLRAAVGHAHETTSGPAAELAKRLRQAPNVVEVLRYRVGPSVGAHTGPLAFGAFWWPAGT